MPYRLYALSNLGSMLALRHLSVRRRAVAPDARAGSRLVGRVRRVRDRVRRARVAEPRRAGRDRRQRPNGIAAPPRVATMRSGPRSPPPRRSCCSRSPATCRRTSRRFRSSGCCRSRCISSRSSSASRGATGTAASTSCRCSPPGSSACASRCSRDYHNTPLSVMIPLYCATLFVACMVCHGELARLKPHPRHLTAFFVPFRSAARSAACSSA